MSPELTPGQIAKRIQRGQHPFMSATTTVYAPLKVRRKRIRGDRRKAKAK